MRRFYVTTPIYYVNDQPHIGHTYTTIVADALARYHRLRGEEVYFLTGTDEHGQKMQRAAEARGVSPQQLADEVVENYRRLWPALGISHDDLIRTTEERHRRGVYALFERIRENDRNLSDDERRLYKGTYRGLYCTGCESFYPANQVKDGRCPEQGHPVEEVEEESWFFKLSAYRKELLRLLDENPEFVQPESRRNEVRGFLIEGLNDLSISRSRAQVSWGIPFPGDPDHVVYVWFDALTNYISALGYGSDDRSLYERFWGKADDSVQLHLIGKDILRFHAVYWPAFLMAAGEPLPATIFAHGWWLLDEAKMSKTRGNVVRPWPLIEDFGADALRWFLLREISLGLDGSYSDEALIERANADLANNIGNLFSRVVALVGRHEGGRIPEVEPVADDELKAASMTARDVYKTALDQHDPAWALRALTEWADALNRFLVRHEPWRRAGREEECSRVLRTACGELALLALHLHPAMPFAAARLWRTLGLGDDPATEIRPGRDLLAEGSWPVGGARVGRGEAVFPRLDKRRLLAGDGAREAAPAASKKKERKATEDTARMEEDGLISIGEFRKVRLRTARVVACEPHPNADKLLRLEVDLGAERRQIVAGIAEHYRPEELVGRTIVVVANLQPAKLRGLASQGMLLAASAPDGSVRLLSVDGDLPPGAEVS